MNGVEELVRDALREQAAEQRPGASRLAERVLAAHRRRARRRVGAAATAVAAVVGLAFWGPLPGGPAPSGGIRPSAPEISAHPDQSPPRDVIAAGNVVMAAYEEQDQVNFGGAKGGEWRRTYWLLDPDSQTYEKDERWSEVAVAPGARRAMVLERELPTRRIGVLDLRTREVERWIELDGDERQGVAGLALSADGASLLATTYRDDPDRLEQFTGDNGEVDLMPPRESARTGFWVVDVASGRGSWSEVEVPTTEEGVMPGMSAVNARQDFEFTRDGRAVKGGLVTGARREFHDLRGRPVEPPAGEAHWEWSVDAGLSPDGRRVAGPFAGVSRKTSSWILDARTGKQLAEIPGQQLVAWAGKDQLVAWDMSKGSTSEYATRLVLVTIGSDRTVPLSGPRSDKGDDNGRWKPLFVPR